MTTHHSDGVGRLDLGGRDDGEVGDVRHAVDDRHDWDGDIDCAWHVPVRVLHLLRYEVQEIPATKQGRLSVTSTTPYIATELTNRKEVTFSPPQLRYSRLGHDPRPAH